MTAIQQEKPHIRFTLPAILNQPLIISIFPKLAGNAIEVLKMLSGTDTSGEIRSGYTESGADVNGDNLIGVEELIYILQVVSHIR